MACLENQPLGQSSNDHGSFRRRIAHPTLQTLYDFWLARRGDRIAMLRADLEPTAIPLLLKNLILTDVSNGGRAIRYRLVGTDIVAAHGVDYTGKTIDEFTGGTILEYVRTLYGLVLSKATPVYSEGQFRWPDQGYRWTKRLHLPLSREGAIIDMVLAGQVFEPESTREQELLVPARPEELAADRAHLGGGSRSL
jgi:hypothetical protein